MIGSELREWRNRMHWTQRQAAEALGVACRTYQSLENGHSPITRPYELATQALEHPFNPQWKPLSELTNRPRPIVRWHKLWDCPIVVTKLNPPMHGMPWLEATKTMTWPEEAFLPGFKYLSEFYGPDEFSKGLSPAKVRRMGWAREGTSEFITRTNMPLWIRLGRYTVDETRTKKEALKLVAAAREMVDLNGDPGTPKEIEEELWQIVEEITGERPQHWG